MDSATGTIARPALEVPPPTGAAHVASWEQDQPMPSRSFFGVPRGVSGRTTVVGTAGHQWADGSIESGASIDIIGLRDGLSSGQARELASALLEAADEVDEWLSR
jgi:hypothetical protein